MKRNKRKLYESIMRNIGKSIKPLIEEYIPRQRRNSISAIKTLTCEEKLRQFIDYFSNKGYQSIECDKNDLFYEILDSPTQLGDDWFVNFRGSYYVNNADIVRLPYMFYIPEDWYNNKFWLLEELYRIYSEGHNKTYWYIDGIGFETNNENQLVILLRMKFVDGIYMKISNSKLPVKFEKFDINEQKTIIEEIEKMIDKKE